MKKIKSILILASTILLSSCTIYDRVGSLESSSDYTSSNSKNSSSSTSPDAYVPTKSELKGINITEIEHNTPSTGAPKVLVLPIQFTDNKFTSDELSDMEKVIAGSSEDTNYWESLKSFYYKSSYGKLNIDFTFADPYTYSGTAKSFYNKYGSGNNVDYEIGPAYVMAQAVKQYKSENNTKCTEFDEDEDGYIDSVIMVYSEEYTPSYDESGALFWAFRYWAIEQSRGTYDYPSANESSPVGYSYMWLSQDFFHEGSDEGLDAHTLIHEFGHMLGADDYYNGSSSRSHSTENPAGGKLMMDNNVLDHDAFNKLQYGWVSPYYVTDSCEITISSFESSGDCILLADENCWNGSPFDEYVLIELFTPTGLNELDSATQYSGFYYPNPKNASYGSGYQSAGIRMWHVDNRLWEYKSYNNDSGAYLGAQYCSDENVANDTLTSGYYLGGVAASNTYDYLAPVVDDDDIRVLKMISSQGTSFKAGSSSTDSDLFHEGDKFSIADSSLKNKFSKYFANKTTLHNGNSLPWTVEITSLSDDEATIKITKVG